MIPNYKEVHCVTAVGQTVEISSAILQDSITRHIKLSTQLHTRTHQQSTRHQFAKTGNLVLDGLLPHESANLK